MAYNKIPPTKSNLLKTKQVYKIATEGYHLLEQKREILVIELMSYSEKIKRIEKELDHLIFDAYDTLKQTVLNLGFVETLNRTKYINYDYTMRKKTVKLIGMKMPSVEIDSPKLSIQFTFLNTMSLMDKSSVKFLKLIDLLCELAEIRAIVWRLSKEVKKVQRRVNALEKIMIPEAKRTIKFIEDTLEEKDREEIYIKKLVKERSIN